MMFLKKSTFIFFLTFLWIHISCQKEFVIPEGIDHELFNRWEWVGSSGGFAGTSITPASAKYSQEIQFTADGIYTKFKNGKSVIKTKFEITKGKSIFSQSESFIIKFKKGEFNHSFLVSHDTLFLNEELYDGFGHIYLKKMPGTAELGRTN